MDQPDLIFEEQARDARWVVVGGGAIGTAVAHALTEAGEKDVLLLERGDELACATTSQGAGLAGQLRMSMDRIKLAMRSVETFSKLQAAPGRKPHWNQVGSLRLAHETDRVREFKELIQQAEKAGLEAALIDSIEAARLWPGLNFQGVKSILWIPTDGFVVTRELASSYAWHAMQKGAKLMKRTRVDRILSKGGRVTGVETNRGAIRCEYVVNAAGAHAYHVASLAGLELPIVPVRHEYFVTEPLAGLHDGLPTFRVPDRTLYGRVRDGGLLLGGWEPSALSLDPRKFANSEPSPEIEQDWPVLNHFAELFSDLFPQGVEAPKPRVYKGWPTFTPDGQFIVGESSKLKGFVMAGGCNAHGVSGSGGLAKHLIEALFDKRPSDYVLSMSPNRYLEHAWNWTEAQAAARRIYESYYAVSH